MTILTIHSPCADSAFSATAYTTAERAYAVRRRWSVADEPVRDDDFPEANDHHTSGVDPRTLQRTNRIYYMGDDGRRREGTVTDVYWRGTVQRFDVLWDESLPGDPAPWRGASHGL